MSGSSGIGAVCHRPAASQRSAGHAVACAQIERVAADAARARALRHTSRECTGPGARRSSGSPPTTRRRSSHRPAYASPQCSGPGGTAMTTSPRPFELHVPDAAIADLRERLARTRWPDQAPEAPWAYGTDVGYLQSLVAHWK